MVYEVYGLVEEEIGAVESLNALRGTKTLKGARCQRIQGTDVREPQSND
jgi:hypothetical protein